MTECVAAADQADQIIRLAILGATGSIGRQAVSVCRAHPDKVRIVALSANDHVEALVELAHEFSAAAIAVANEAHRGSAVFQDLPCEVSFGAKAVASLAQRDDVDVVLNAVVGAAGIDVAFSALTAGKRLLSANKESLVVAGDILMSMAAPHQIIPVDSEHSAIFQCLVGERLQDLRYLWLTCSGGPFRGYSRAQLAGVCPADALAHPTWQMGAKITIDSATLMNKGLEIIEAAQLFAVDIDQIRVVVHPQSRVHSMVEFIDGSTKAQLGASDMRVPIQYALSYPARWESVVADVDYVVEPPLMFSEPDEQVFGCLRLAREAGRVGGTLPCAMNAANEVANQAFRDGACGFLDIERIVQTVMDATRVERVESIQQLSDVDAAARRHAYAFLQKKGH